MGIPKHKYLDETVMRQAFMGMEYSNTPLIKTIITAIKRRVGSRLLPGVHINRVQRKRRG